MTKQTREDQIKKIQDRLDLIESNFDLLFTQIQTTDERKNISMISRLYAWFKSKFSLGE